jgi:hypothetical protein
MTPSEALEFAPTPEPAPMSEPARLVGVFFSPGKAFADIARRPSWWVPIVLSMIVTTVFLYLFSQHVGWDTFISSQLDQSAQGRNMTAQQRQQVLKLYSVLGKGIAIGGGLIGPIFATTLFAAVLKFLADTIMGAGIGFKRMMAVVAYGTLPNLLAGLLAILVMYLKPPDEFDLNNPVMLNAGLFLGQKSPIWMQRLASSFDLFTFWCMILIAIGMAAAGRKLTVGKALGMIIFPWALWVILKTGAAAAFG